MLFIISLVLISALLWMQYSHYEESSIHNLKQDMKSKVGYLEKGLQQVAAQATEWSKNRELEKLLTNTQLIWQNNQPAEHHFDRWLNLKLNALNNGKVEKNLITIDQEIPLTSQTSIPKLFNLAVPENLSALFSQPEIAEASVITQNQAYQISGNYRYKNIYEFLVEQQKLFYTLLAGAITLSLLLTILLNRRTSGSTASSSLIDDENRFAAVFNNSRDLFLELDQFGNITYSSDNSAKIIGFPPKEMVGKSIYSLLYPKTAKNDEQNIERLIQYGADADSLEVSFVSVNQGQVLLDTNIQVKKDQKDQVTGLIVLGRDITESRKERHQILKQVYFDSLTNLPNRESLTGHLQTHLKEVIQRKDLVLSAVVLLDLDDFKDVNRFQSQQLGDEILKELANRLRTFFADKDVIFRLSSDQFLIIVTSPNRMLMPEFKSKLQLLIGELLHSINNPIILKDSTIRVTASAGVLFIPQDGRNPNEILAHAETALEQAKKAGKNCYRYFDASLHDLIDQRRQLVKELKKAIQNLEFKLLYQLQIDTEAKNVYGMEALIRWQHPTRNVLVSPNEFLNIAIDSNLIQAIDEWVIDQAFKEIKELHKSIHQIIPVSINLSAKSIENPAITEIIAAKLQEYELIAQDIRIEVTETSILKNIEQTIENLKNLQKLGIQTSIDDFGTGYSSLSYLQKLPVDSLKIDKSFIDGISSSNKDLQICKSIIQLGKSLDKNLIAEGVQSEKQQQLLQAEGCNIIQGYLYSKPMPINDVMLLLSQQKFNFDLESSPEKPAKTTVKQTDNLLKIKT